MANSLVTFSSWRWLKELNTLNASVFTVVWLFVFILRSLQVTVKKYLKESLLSICVSSLKEKFLQKMVGS